ncbi:hypothetical protein J2810_001878 [Chryseobacterium rhizosphaerae]|nr:hypothetical protein [Chryseobacterium rhizosphaerae]
MMKRINGGSNQFNMNGGDEPPTQFPQGGMSSRC